MKSLFFVVAASLFLFSCGSNNKAKAPKADTLLTEAGYVLSAQTLAFIWGPVKRVIVTAWQVSNIDSTQKKLITDTFYLIPTADTSMSWGKPIIDSITHKPVAHLTFRNPLYLNKKYVQPSSVNFPDIKAE